MALRELFKSFRNNSFLFIFSILLTSFFIIGGCNDNNNGNGDGGGLGATETSCSTISKPCNITSISDNSTRFECTSLSNDACAVDLEDVVNQVDPDGTAVNNNTIMWIEAWGGKGGKSDKGAVGGVTGYAVTTTTIDGIKNKNSGSSTIYYFMGTPGINGPERCAGGGGTATIVTTEDLVLNPDSNPTHAAPPILLVAGGSGSGAAANKVGLCVNSTKFDGGHGGIAIASIDEDGQGEGLSSDGAGFGSGGNTDGKCGGGEGSANGVAGGNSGFGGLGGIGGSGPDCTGRGANNFSNTPVELSMTSGRGGDGETRKGSCASGGGAGGGGCGGGGGGNHGNDSIQQVGGAGGGSFAIQSTHLSTKAPTTRQTSPCGADNGCVRITFVTE